MKNLLKVSIVILLIIFSSTANAWHITGGEMSYECLGNNQYEITMKIYRDCQIQSNPAAPFDNPAMISVFDGNNNQVSVVGTSNTVSVPISNGPNNIYSSVGNPCVTNTDICVEEAVYTVTLTLPYNPTGYHITYQRCCLNSTITNIFNPNSFGTTITTFISEQGQSLCNANPTFNNTHIPAICVGQILSINDFTATDSDGDSLSYSFVAPYTGFQQGNPGPGPANPPPYSTVPFIPPLSGLNPIGGFPQVTIDSITGIISGLPVQTGQYVLAIAVKEYRNGIHIGTVRKQCQINIIPCNLIVDTIQTELCLGDTIVFNNTVYDSTGIYIDTLSSSYGCDSLVILLLNVNPPIALLDTIIVSDGGNFSGQISLILAGGSQNYTYTWSNGDTTPIVSNLSASNYIVTISDNLGCQTSFTFTVDLDVSANEQLFDNDRIIVHPNPVKSSGIINLRIESMMNEKISISIVSISGQVIKNLNTIVNSGNNSVQIPVENLDGLYYLKIQNEERTLQKMIPIQVIK